MPVRSWTWNCWTDFRFSTPHHAKGPGRIPLQGAPGLFYAPFAHVTAPVTTLSPVYFPHIIQCCK